MRKIPVYINNYLENVGMARKPVAKAVVLKNSGNITEFDGKFKQFFGFKPKCGESIEKLSPLFIGLFPAQGDVIELPRIETKPDKYLDVFIFIAAIDVWILFYDSSKEVRAIKKETQKRNNEYLDQYRKEKEHAGNL